MSDIKNTIQHPGRIDKIEKDKIMVTILSQSACSTCHAKGMCTVSEMEEKTIEVKYQEENQFVVGEQVTVYMKRSLGSKAVLYGYFLPFLIVLLSLIILIAITKMEGLSALFSLGLLIPYYYILHRMKDRLSNTFEFSLKP